MNDRTVIGDSPRRRDPAGNRIRCIKEPVVRFVAMAPLPASTDSAGITRPGGPVSGSRVRRSIRSAPP